MKALIIAIAYVSYAFGSLSIKLLEPTSKTMWTTGKDVELYWKLEGTSDEKSVKVIELDLWQGRNKKPELVDNIAFGVKINQGDVFWTVNKNLQTGDDYFIRITSPENPDFIYDSHYITIRNAASVGGAKKTANGERVSANTENASGRLVPSSMLISFMMVAALIV